MPSAEDLSKWISIYMDEHGFDKQSITDRISFQGKLSTAINIFTKYIHKNENIEEIIAGSMSEGTGMLYCNDTDILHVNLDVICCYNSKNIDNDKLCFKMEQTGVPAGYTLLKLTSIGTASETYESLKYAVVERNRHKYLSSKKFMAKNDNILQLTKNSFLYKNTYYDKPHGPSIPIYIKNIPTFMNLTDEGTDFVRAFPCQPNGEILKAWKKRKRTCDWPNQETIAHVMTLPVHVVPVGKDGNINEDLQWRVSFTLAEIHLIQAFNNIQTKVLVLFKLMAKHIFKPLCSDISSYVVKTVMLWQVENIPRAEFSDEKLLLRLTDAITYLKNAIKDKNLPSYMLPERNLFENKITWREQQLLLRELTDLEVNGINIVDAFSNGRCPCHYYSKIQTISERFYNANSMNIFLTFMFSCNTPEDLAHWGSEILRSKSLDNITIYTILFILISFHLKYDEMDVPLQNAKKKRKRRAKTRESKKRKL